MSNNAPRQLPCTRCGRPLLVGSEQTAVRCGYCQHMNTNLPPAKSVKMTHIAPPSAVDRSSGRPRVPAPSPPEPRPEPQMLVTHYCEQCREGYQLAVADGKEQRYRCSNCLHLNIHSPNVPAPLPQDEAKSRNGCIACHKPVGASSKDGVVRCEHCGMRQLEGWLGAVR